MRDKITTVIADKRSGIRNRIIGTIKKATLKRVQGDEFKTVGWDCYPNT